MERKEKVLARRGAFLCTQSHTINAETEGKPNRVKKYWQFRNRPVLRILRGGKFERTQISGNIQGTGAFIPEQSHISSHKLIALQWPWPSE